MLTDEQREKFYEGLNATIATAVTAAMSPLTERIGNLESHSRTVVLPGSDSDKHKGDPYDFAKLVISQLSNDRSLAPMEWEAHDECCRAMGISPDSAGGAIVPGEIFQNQIIPALKPNAVSLQLGATVFPVTGSPVEFPKEVGSPIAEAVGEHESAAESEIELAMLGAQPHSAEAIVRASDRFLTMGVGAGNFIRDLISREIGLKWDSFVLTGTGTMGNPTGITNKLGTQGVTFSGAVAAGIVEKLMYTAARKMIHLTRKAEALGLQGLGFATGHDFVEAMHQLHDENISAGTSQMSFARKIFSDADETRMIGQPFATTGQLTSGAVTQAIFGPFGSIIIPTWGNLTIRSSQEAGNLTWQQRQTLIMGYMDMDVVIPHPVAFTLATSLDTSSL